MKQIKEQNIRLINERQHTLYETYEKRFSIYYLSLYERILKTVKTKTEIKILDIGGASGHFAMELYSYFEASNCKIVVLDSLKYDTWSMFSDKIDFIKASVDDVNQLFAENTFDIIFANRVVHHFVRKTWKETVDGIYGIIGNIYSVLRPGGYFCVSDHFYNGFIYDKITSIIIYELTACKITAIKKVCQKLGAESAGTGVCFLSKNMWMKLLSGNSFKIAFLVENKKLSDMKIYKKVLLFSKSIRMNNTIICKKPTLT
ncbi:MAG: class I SAM-dependent methyltransferase [Tannerella sp.]|jgi:ubiquinone/menaquinone biosynthesis C-methylase UbiE|nr:class I SAM-dependent methyltransferase [Tannerella sp.]